MVLLWQHLKVMVSLICSRGLWLMCWIVFFFQITLRANNSAELNGKDHIVFINDVVKIVISQNAELVSCIDLRAKTDIAAHNHQKIAYAKTIGGKILEAEKVTLNDSVLSVTIGGHSVILKEKTFFYLT